MSLLKNTKNKYYGYLLNKIPAVFFTHRNETSLDGVQQKGWSYELYDLRRLQWIPRNGEAARSLTLMGFVPAEMRGTKAKSALGCGGGVLKRGATLAV